MEGVETRHGTPKFCKKHGEGIVQTTNNNGDENHSGMKIPFPLRECRFESGFGHII
jgi:hypothetical protein